MDGRSFVVFVIEMTVSLILILAGALVVVLTLVLLLGFLGRGLGAGTQADAPRRGLSGEYVRSGVLEHRSRIGRRR
jgi:hypothetical protein